MDRFRFHPFTAACCAAVAGALLVLTGMRPAQDGVTPEQLEILRTMRLVKLPDGLGGMKVTVRFSDVNLQLVNGDGATASKDGTGNLILGYGESLNPTVRDGSHNLVVGQDHSYTSYGGVVFGQSNQILDACASVTGGEANRVEGFASHVSAGSENVAGGSYCAVVGGSGNAALEGWTCVLGGFDNLIHGVGGTVAGGQENFCSGLAATILGGSENSNLGQYATMTGGCNNATAAGCVVVP